MIERTTKRKAYETKLPVSVVARVNSECADWEMSNANEFTHGTHDRNLNPATPAVEKYLYHNKIAIEEGAQVLREGGELTDGDFAHGNFVKPFVYRMEYRPGTFCLREEAFSPHVAIIPVDGLEQAVEVYNDTDYGLALAVITEDYRKWRYVRDNCDYGLGYVNLPSIGAEVHLPFGGVKNSGNGHPSAEGLLDAVTHRTAFTVNHSKKITLAQGLSADL